MMSYELIKKLRPALFKRHCGVKPKTFEKMVSVVSDSIQKNQIKSGRPPKLSIEDHVLMTLEYWREYRTYFHLGNSWGVHESSVCRIIKRVEDILIKSKAFSLPGKKRLQSSDYELEGIVVDVAEIPIERPKKTKKLLQWQKEAPYIKGTTGYQ